MSQKSKAIQLIISGKNKTKSAFSSVIKGLKSFSVSALKITAGISAAFGIVAFTLSKIADQIDGQAKVASSLGMANEALSVFKDAARYAGISSQNLTVALRYMSQGIADAVNGTGEAKDALKDLGLNAEELQREGPEKAFRRIIQELDKMPEGIKKTQVLMDLFGRSGLAMGNLTSKGLKQAQADAEKLGLKLSTAQAKGVEAANDAWSRIKIAGSDFLKFVTAKLAPGIEKGLTKAFDWIKKQNLEAWAAKAAKGIGTAFQAAAVIVGGVAEAVIAITRGLAGAVGIVNSLTKDSLEGLLNRHVSKLDAINEKIKTLEQLGGSGGADMRDLMSQREVTENSIRDTYSALNSAQELERSTKNISKNLKDAQGFSASPEVQKALSTLNDLVGDLGGTSEKTGEQVKETGGTMRIAFSGTAEAAAIAGDKMARINAILAEMKAKAEAAAAAIKDIPDMPGGSAGGGSGSAEDFAQRLEDEAER